ncbi:MAG: penicillin acylase family protein [Chloroflexi bacterium]|nr:penicillin acylase family protein [Chloroflexota bacterium]
MRRLKKTILIVLLVIVALPLLASLGAYFGLVRPALPQLDGELALAGLEEQVIIQRDQNGIPHILAGNVHDLFFAQGFVHAQDRLWAMESARQAAHGTLSEVVGERALNNDRFMRILGMTESAEADWATLDSGTQAVLQAYADGVNAFIEQAGGKLPLEFRILGIRPKPWTPIDSLVFGKLVAWGLSNNYQDELVISLLAGQTEWETVLDILPDYPGPDVIPDAQRAMLGLTAKALMDFNLSWQGGNPLARPDQGSNAWVVGGSHTASGAPLLANDPHQGLSMPTLWYEVGLHTTSGEFEVAGGSLPGLPGVMIGHNARIAWGVTNARPDVQDLFIETLSSDGTQYLFLDEWLDLTLREETILVKDGDPFVITVRSTHHGPLVTDAIESSDQRLALRWTGLDQGRPLAQAIIQLDRAGNWDEFRAALQSWQLPSMNFLYADVDGNIGYLMPGAVPLRAGNDFFGLLPVPGADGAHEWTGFVPYDELPHAYNPAGDFFASANNRPAGGDYPYFLSHYFQPPYRVALISETIRNASGLGVDEFAALQASWYSQLNLQVAQILVNEASPQDAAGQAALGLLAGWDGMMTPDSSAAALTELVLPHILQAVLTPVFGEEATGKYMTLAGYPYMFLQEILDDPSSPWWNGDRSGVLESALDGAVAGLSESLGGDPAGWEWGRLHTMTFSHPLGSIGPLAPVFNRGPFPTGGNWNTVDSGAYLPGNTFAMTLGAAYRIISDPGDWDNSLSVIPSGQSGQPFSPYYDDQIESWLAVEYHALPFSLPAIEAAARHILTLVP